MSVPDADINVMFHVHFEYGTGVDLTGVVGMSSRVYAKQDQPPVVQKGDAAQLTSTFSVP